ncbi:hypothetical protein [Micromonospora sp. NPDC004551]|uniref:hypothetical protein n=1 Tax=Micromonospora sp. NPDC004551 TaxID=3154284 RepID=UPI0033B006E8
MADRSSQAVRHTGVASKSPLSSARPRPTVDMYLGHSDDIATAIRTRHLQTTIARALCYGVDTPAADVANALTDAGFDFAPVTRDGEICGYADRADLVDQPGSLVRLGSPGGPSAPG